MKLGSLVLGKLIRLGSLDRYLQDLANKCLSCSMISQLLENLIQMPEDCIDGELVNDGYGVYELIHEKDPIVEDEEDDKDAAEAYAVE